MSDKKDHKEWIAELLEKEFKFLSTRILREIRLAQEDFIAINEQLERTQAVIRQLL
ncbi:hypothetical protein [Brevibacillus centrosporus]|uniref:hypothetical protein n=1 Tax=Brevibacillus centrosporus TaxID=54910 RepID=UPI00380B62FF